MRNLTIGDLKLGLRDLLDEKGEALRSSATGKMYEPRLRAKQKEIDAIPEAASTAAPLAKELSEADVRHDGFGAAIFYLCEAIHAHPTLPAGVKASAAQVQEAFVPKLEVLRANYADEAFAALENRPELVRLKSELKSLAAPGGGTVYDWAKGFLGAGDEIDKLLSKRATLLAAGTTAAATGPLRGATVGLLGRFREALRDEIQEPDSKLPADLEARLFAYLDKLNADRDRALRARASKDEGAAPPAVAPPAGETPADGAPVAPTNADP